MIQKSGPYVTLILVLIPIILWLPSSNWTNIASVMRSLSQLTGLTGMVLLCLSFVLSARFKFVENLFSGLNRVFIYHHLIGVASFILLLIHPVASTIGYWKISLSAALSLITPSLTNWVVSIGILGLLTMIILLVLTIYIKLEYQTWKSTHQWLGLALLLGTIHALFINSTISTNYWLRSYIIILITIATCSFIYRMFNKITNSTSLLYSINQINPMGDIQTISLQPNGRPLVYHPGQFAFLKIKQLGIRLESHPFSITSSPQESNLTFAIKSLGDFTETLKLLQPQTEVLVEGPYGKFGNNYTKHDRQLWIAGGIGVTPFLSMLKALSPNFTGEINFYYCTKDPQEAVFMNEIYSLSQQKPSIRVSNYTSSEHGRLNAQYLANEVYQIQNNEVYLCGPPPMMASMKTQLIELGVKAHKIHTEEFALSD